MLDNSTDSLVLKEKWEKKEIKLTNTTWWYVIHEL